MGRAACWLVFGSRCLVALAPSPGRGLSRDSASVRARFVGVGVGLSRALRDAPAIRADADRIVCPVLPGVPRGRGALGAGRRGVSFLSRSVWGGGVLDGR